MFFTGHDKSNDAHSAHHRLFKPKTEGKVGRKPDEHGALYDSEVFVAVVGKFHLLGLVALAQLTPLNLASIARHLVHDVVEHLVVARENL